MTDVQPRSGAALSPEAVFRAAVRMGETLDLARFEELISDQYVGHVAIGDRDREGLRQRILEFRDQFPAMRFDVKDQFACGDRVSTRMVASGRNVNGATVTLMGLNIARVGDGQLLEEWNTWERRFNGEVSCT